MNTKKRLVAICLAFALAMVNSTVGAQGKPNNIAATTEQAVQAYRAADYRRATALFRELTVYSPKDALVWHFLGRSLEKNGDLSGAKNAYQTSFDVNPTGKVAQRNQSFLNALRCPANYNAATWTNCIGEFPSSVGKYVGEFKNGKYDGQGIYTFADGRKYVGGWKGGNYNGQGTLTLSNGTKYVGEFKNGKYDGQGTLTAPDGAKFVGEFRDGKRNGQGTLTFADGVKYVGEFKDDKESGQGTMTLRNGDKYVGEFKDGEPNGQGTVTWVNGEKYVGELKNGKRDGHGIQYGKDGAVLQSGEWKDDKFGATPASVAQAPQKIMYAADIGFGPGSNILTAESTGKLDALAERVALIKLEVIIVLGFTDESDGNSNGIPFSAQRAEAVKSYLAKKGIESNRIYTEGKGSTVGGKGRRVDIEVIGYKSN